MWTTKEGREENLSRLGAYLTGVPYNDPNVRKVIQPESSQDNSSVKTEDKQVAE